MSGLCDSAAATNTTTLADGSAAGRGEDLIERLVELSRHI
jgi:hypothetical protein